MTATFCQFLGSNAIILSYSFISFLSKSLFWILRNALLLCKFVRQLWILWTWIVSALVISSYLLLVLQQFLGGQIWQVFPPARERSASQWSCSSAEGKSIGYEGKSKKTDKIRQWLWSLWIFSNKIFKNYAMFSKIFKTGIQLKHMNFNALCKKMFSLKINFSRVLLS